MKEKELITQVGWVKFIESVEHQNRGIELNSVFSEKTEELPG